MSLDRRFPKTSLKAPKNFLLAEDSFFCKQQNPWVASVHWCVPAFMLGFPLKLSPIWIIGMTSDHFTFPSYLKRPSLLDLSVWCFQSSLFQIDSPQTVQCAKIEKLQENTSSLSRNKILHHLFSEAKTEFTSERSKCYTELLNVAVILR